MGKCKLKIRLKGRDVLGKKVLILGEAGSGKTKLLAELLRELIVLVPPEKMTVIDLAPEKAGGVGGKLTDYVNLTKKVKYFSPEKVYTPRLTGTSPEEVLRHAELNREIMTPLLNRFIHHPTENLAVNDVTLYLHSGELETVLKCAKLAKTFVATAYYGIKLIDDLGTGISARERQLTDKLATFMDSTIRIS
ncbi:MAG: helicase HerA domain-containing protein [Candidatus Bathycorpusculaceae bacterium]